MRNRVRCRLGLVVKYCSGHVHVRWVADITVWLFHDRAFVGDWG